ncbi:MAG: DUF2062 domain-containing protein [Alphaproteobacteria bacterium]|nr:MAG: hypothetical protein B6I23_02705 [Rickettsiaceae bacterium 4572_127]
MLFRRGKPLSLWRKIINFIWPQIGFKRAGKYIYLRILRIKDNPKGVAKGLALGIAISITPFVGFHLILIGILCWILRGNFLAGVLSSLLGNPITFPFIWYATYLLGVTILPISTGSVDLSPLPLFEMFGYFVKSVWTLNLSLFIEKVWPVWFPMLIGSIPLFIISFVLVYTTSLKILRRNR